MVLGDVNIPTAGFVPIPVEGNIQYQDLSIEFIVDEDLRNYMELHNWMRALEHLKVVEKEINGKA